MTIVSAEYALKEWDAQVQALTLGRTALIVRKGGIMETHEGFQLEHPEFFLYPTFLHQNPDELHADYRGLLRPDPQPGEVVFPAHARAVKAWRITSEERAVALADLQALNADSIRRRFHYRGRPVLHAVLLHITRLTEAHVLVETPEMLGCVSWVPLPEQLKLHGESVMSDEELQGVREEVERRLG